MTDQQLIALNHARLRAVYHLQSMEIARNLLPCEETALMVLGAELVVLSYDALLDGDVDRAAHLTERAEAIEAKLTGRRRACPARVQYATAKAEEGRWN